MEIVYSPQHTCTAALPMVKRSMRSPAPNAHAWRPPDLDANRSWTGAQPLAASNTSIVGVSGRLDDPGATLATLAATPAHRGATAVRP